MVLYKGYCRPLGKKVDFTVEDVISMNTKRGIKWRVKGKFEDYNISTFCSEEIAQELLSKLPLKMDAEIAYTPPPTTYEAEELIPSFSNNSKPSEPPIITYEAEELVPYTIKKSKAEDGMMVHEQIQENTNAHELELQSEKLPAKYYKKDGSLDMRYTVCREFAAKQAESQNAVELEAPYTPIEPERPSDDYGGGGRHRKKPRRPLGAEEKCDICSEGPIYEKDVNIEDYDNPIQVCQSCFDDTFTDIAAESFDAERIKQNIIPRGLEGNRVFVVSSVDYETDGEDVDLPQNFTFILDEHDTALLDGSKDMQEIADLLVDNISDETGWLVQGFYFQERMPDGTLVDLDAESFEAEEYTVEITGFMDDTLNPTTKRIKGTEQELKDELFDFHYPYDRIIDYGLDDIEDEEEAMQRLIEKWNKQSIKTICDDDDMLTLITSEQLDAESFEAPKGHKFTPFKDSQSGERMNMRINSHDMKKFDNLKPYPNTIIVKNLKDGKRYKIRKPQEGKGADVVEQLDAESFEAAYTPEQRLDDYTPEQLTTSSAVTGDFFEDSLKYSYGGFQAETEELGETSYAEDVPALQRAEAGMEVEDIEQAYKKKEDQFMTLVVDDATLFRLAPELPAFVEMENTQLAGYTSLKFNFVENPEMEQKILSYAIDVVDDKDDETEEPEFKEGDVRNRLFNVEFDDWAEQEMLTHGKDVSFKEWADEESESHGDEEFMDWAKHEEESHDERYEAEGAKRRSSKVWGLKWGRKYWQDKFELQMQDWLEFAWANRDNPEFKTYQGETLVRNNMGVKKSNIPTGTKMRNVINTDELYKAWKKQSPVIEATAEKRCLVSYQEAVPEMHIFLDYMEDAGIDIKEAEWRNLSDFEMGDRDRYALGDEIIAISQTLRENKVDDWRAVKKLGKAIKQGKFTRVRDEMGNIGIYSRRAVWDKHHKDFFELFSDSQIQALGIPWVVNDYRAEITDEDLSELESKLDRKIDSYVKGLNYTQCVACDKEAKVEILEDKDGNAVYHFYSCECGHNDIQDSSYDAESANKYQLMAEEVGGLYQVLNNRGFKIEFDNGYELSVMIGAGTYSDNYDMSPIGEMGRGLESSTAEIAVIHKGLMLPLDEDGHFGSTIIGYVPTSVLPSLLEAVSKGDDEEIRKVVGQFKRGDFDAETFQAPADGIDSLRKSMKEKKEKLKALYEELEQRKKDLKEKHDSDIAIYGKVLGDKKFTDRIKVTERKIEKHMNSIEKLQEKINAKFKLGYRDDFVLKKIRSNDPTANTASESTYRFDHRYSGSARQRRLLRRKAEESFEAPSAFDNEDIIAYLENSHRSIRKYNAPHRYTSRGIANHFGVAGSNISKRMKILKNEGIVSEVKRRVEDSPDEYGTTSPVSVFYLTENKLMQAEESDGFIARIPKSKSMGEKNEILKNNVKIIFEQAQRPLYPMEFMALYEQKKYGDKPQRKSKYKSSPRAKKLGFIQRDLTRIVNTQPDKYYVSRRGLIHYIGEGSMQDYIKNLDPKYFAEDDSKSYNYLPDEDDILKFLKESHRFIRKYNAPYRYTSKGMAQKFGVSQDAMRGRMGKMERAGKVKSTKRRCEDAPPQHRRNPLNIYYLPDKKLMGAENRSPSYMVDSDVDSLVDSSERLEDMVDERKEYPEWWKSQLSVSSDKVDGLADFLEYAERNDKV